MRCRWAAGPSTGSFLSGAWPPEWTGWWWAATFPEIIRGCRQTAGRRVDIISPGVGAQGGSARKAFEHGSDYVIVGRSLLNSKDPAGTAKSILS